MFQGFTEETIQFMWGIRMNNRRDWFLEHKPVYQRALYEPMKELAAELQRRLNEKYPQLLLEARVTRIYRDARRVKYGGLYKDHLWLVLREPAEDENPRPAFYFEARPEEYEFGMGYWCPRPALMEKFRRKVLREPERLEKLARRLNRQSDFHLYGSEYKRPKGEVSDLLKPWFNRKDIGLTCSRSYEGDTTFFQPQLLDEVLEGFDWLMPYFAFFQELSLEPEPETALRKPKAKPEPKWPNGEPEW